MAFMTDTYRLEYLLRRGKLSFLITFNQLTSRLFLVVGSSNFLSYYSHLYYFSFKTNIVLQTEYVLTCIFACIENPIP